MFSRSQQGFTLVELMVVLLLLAIVGGLVSARLSVRSGSENLRAVAYKLASHYRAARAGAVRGAADHIVLIDLANRVVTAGGEELLRVPEAIKIVAETSAAERRSASVAGVRFLPNGSSTGGTVRLESGGQAYAVRINWFTGRVSVELAP
jgi:general secretion pathway protein H